MRDCIHIETRHFAHIRIVPRKDARKDHPYLVDEIIAKQNELIKEHAVTRPDGSQSVQEDTEFCCMIETEVGLVGSSLIHVATVANALADWAENHPNLELRAL